MVEIVSVEGEPHACDAAIRYSGSPITPGVAMRDTKIENNVRAKCYEYYLVGELAAFADYSLDGNILSLVHTRVIPEYEGKGVAQTLVRGILDEAKASNLQVLPVCEYVAAFIGKNQDEYLELVPAGKRADFKI
jgi:hypothetical protein